MDARLTQIYFEWGHLIFSLLTRQIEEEIIDKHIWALN